MDQLQLELAQLDARREALKKRISELEGEKSKRGCVEKVAPATEFELQVEPLRDQSADYPEERLLMTELGDMTPNCTYYFMQDHGVEKEECTMLRGTYLRLERNEGRPELVFRYVQMYTKAASGSASKGRWADLFTEPKREYIMSARDYFFYDHWN